MPLWYHDYAELMTDKLLSNLSGCCPTILRIGTHESIKAATVASPEESSSFEMVTDRRRTGSWARYLAAIIIEAIKQSATSGRCGTSDTRSLSRWHTSNVDSQVYTHTHRFHQPHADVQFLSLLLTSVMVMGNRFSTCIQPTNCLPLSPVTTDDLYSSTRGRSISVYAGFQNGGGPTIMFM